MLDADVGVLTVRSDQHLNTSSYDLSSDRGGESSEKDRTETES